MSRKNKVTLKKFPFNKFNQLLTYYVIKVEVRISANAEILWPCMCIPNFRTIGQAVWAVFRRQENVSGRGAAADAAADAARRSLNHSIRWLFIVWKCMKWGHVDVLITLFQFHCCLMIINNLKWLSLLLARIKIVSLFVLWKWGHDDVLVMSFQFRWSLMIINRLNWLSLLLTRERIVSLFVVWKWGHDGVLVMVKFITDKGKHS